MTTTTTASRSSLGTPKAAGGGGGSAAVEERRITSLTRQGSDASASARRVAQETLAVATATLSELEMQTQGLSRVARELESCEMSVLKVCGD